MSPAMASEFFTTEPPRKPFTLPLNIPPSLRHLVEGRGRDWNSLRVQTSRGRFLHYHISFCIYHHHQGWIFISILKKRKWRLRELHMWPSITHWWGVELGVSYSCDCLSRALGDPAVVLSFRDNHLIEETGGGSLGGSVLQWSGSHQEHSQPRAHFSSPPHDLVSPSILNVILSEIHRGFQFAEPTAQFPIQPPNLPPARRKEISTSYWNNSPFMYLLT